MSVQGHPSSFRDPAGFVFSEDGILKRGVTHLGQPDYEQFMRSGLYEDLVGRNWILPHDEEEIAEKGEQGIWKVLIPQKLDYISYPYEWSFDQLKDAALLTLRIQRVALGYGMSLKDASAFNIQFLGCQPIFIDTLSFESNRQRYWVAYRQFCEHFVGPLLLMSHVSPDWSQLFRSSLDGIPLRLASDLLPASTYCRPGPLVHVHLHARMQRKSLDAGRYPPVREAAGIDRKPAIVDSLIAAVQRIKLRNVESSWSRYSAEATHYSTTAEQFKREAVESAMDLVQPASVLDVGGNDGAYARLATARGIRCICLDSDPLCVNQNYLLSKKNRDTGMLPLLMDITNPSPSLGFDGCERMSFMDRTKPDLVLALAILHHLRVRANIPFLRLAGFLAKISKWLLIEYVPKSDAKVRVLMMGRKDLFEDYSLQGFLEVFGAHFKHEWSREIPENGRSLHLFRKRI